MLVYYIQSGDNNGGISNANPINNWNKHQQYNNDDFHEEDPSTLSWSFRYKGVGKI